jgi:LuxR family transcriptional regulator, maltose regulon positive regulatory protein
VTQLHTRAAEWFAAHGFVDEAVGHAIAAGSAAKASQFVQVNWIRYVDAGRAATVDGWLQALPQFEADPTALVTAAWMAVIRGDEPKANSLLLALAETDGNLPIPDGTTSVESAVALIQAMSGYGGPAKMTAAAQRAVELETDARSPWFGLANFALGHARYVAGDLDAAMSVLPKAAYNESSFAIAKQFALAIMAITAREQQNFTLSRRFAVESMAVVEAAALRGVPQSSMAFTALGEIQAVEGDLAGAMVTLDEGLALRQRNSGLNPWPTIYHLLAMGRVTAMDGDLARAEQLLDQAAERCLGSPMEWMPCMPGWGRPGRRFAVTISTIRAGSP